MWYDNKKAFFRECRNGSLEKSKILWKRYEEHDMLHLYFAPLEGITTYPYRNLHHKYFGGVDKYFTPFLAPGPEQGMSVKEMRDVLPENNAGVDEPGRRFSSGIKEISRDGIPGDQPESWMSVGDGHSEEKRFRFFTLPG